MSTATARRSPHRVIIALVRGIRPHQATKNLFVYTAPVFAGKLFYPPAFILTTAAFLLFTLVSGSIYLLNDLKDVEQDRHHPKKRLRPIASGELPESVARIGMLVLAVIAIVAGFQMRAAFGVVLAGYFVLQAAYCYYLKHVVLLDVFSIAAGFVLRTVAGGLAIGINISQWLLLCSLQLALFLGFGKRRQEIVQLGSTAARHRAILQEYSLTFLDQMINLVAGMTIVCYSVYSVESDTAHRHPHLWLTVPFVIYGVCRYLYLVHQKGEGGAPDEVLRKDRSLQVAMMLWLGVVFVLLKLDV